MSMMIIAAAAVVLFLLSLLSHTFFLWLTGKLLRIDGATVRRAAALALVIATFNLGSSAVVWILGRQIDSSPARNALLAMALLVAWIIVPVACTKQVLRTSLGRAILTWLGGEIGGTAIAFLLAFAVRGFLAEAFVVPTGAMAPAIIGAHADVVCAGCGFDYTINMSEWAGPRSQPPLGQIESRCPNCHQRNFLPTPLPIRTGDRILVEKWGTKPSRWEIWALKYPEEPSTNFVERVVGIPNETVQISHGDLYTSAETKPRETLLLIEQLKQHPWDEAGHEIAEKLHKFTGQEFGNDREKWLSWWQGRFREARHIERKPPQMARSMLQVVFDQDFASPELRRKGWPNRWQYRPQSTEKPHAGGWIAERSPVGANERQHVFRTDGSATQEVWVRYRHFIPTAEEWARIEQFASRQDYRPKPRLIDDFVAFNTTRHSGRSGDRDRGNRHWVGDLALACRMETKGNIGEAILELVEGGRRFQCRIDVGSGKAVLSIAGSKPFQPQATTAIRGPGAHDILFANVDDQLLLWVDDALIKFDAPTTYGPLGNRRPTPADLSPLGIASHGAALEISRLRVLRDVYYIAVGDFQMSDFLAPVRDGGVDYLADPPAWQIFDQMREVQFALEDDQYLVLGDNSARSKDSRLWGPESYYVTGDLMIGKAACTYLPIEQWRLFP